MTRGTLSLFGFALGFLLGMLALVAIMPLERLH